MPSRDYTKELGMPTHKKNLPKPIAFAVLALVAVGVSFGVAGIVSETKEHAAAEHAAKAGATQAPAAAPVAPAK
jgi:hypothetical protein